MEASTDWLLEGPAFLRYRTRLDLQGLPADDTAVLSDRTEMLSDPLIRGIIDSLAGWPVKVINSHKSAGHPLHQLSFLADLGLTDGEPGIGLILDQVMAHRDPAGPFYMLMNIPTKFGGEGKDLWAWGLCDAPLLTHALVAMGRGQDSRVKQSIETFIRMARPNGWPCAGCEKYGTFRGPGRKEDPCPYATLVVLKVLSLEEETRLLPAARDGVETILDLWENSLVRHPYIFYMGNDFRKLKAPMVWYDLVHVLDVLSRFPQTRNDPRMADMAACLSGKADPQGRFRIESAWLAWKDWEFGQKTVPSRWLTLLAWRILHRLGTDIPDPTAEPQAGLKQAH